MLRFTIKAEPSAEILCFNRPLPPENTDLILYVEDQISELLFAEETLSDTLYRFSETGEELLIAVARIKTVQQKPVPVNALCYRIPTPIALWLKARAILKPETPSLIYAKYCDIVYLLWADARQVRRIYQLGNGADIEREAKLAVENLCERYSLGDFPLKLYGAEKVSDTLIKELRERSIQFVPITLPSKPPFDKAVFDQWDFRLGSEVNAQEQGRQKRRAVHAGVVTAAGAGLLWLLLFAAGSIFGHLEQRSMDAWKRLQGSMREISFLQKHTRQCISEIMLCQKLSEKRTNRASILEQIADSRPEPLKLEKLLIGERRKRLAGGKKGGAKGDAAYIAEDFLILKGFGREPDRITEWMDLLQKSGVFSNVNLVSMQKNENQYHFQIECGLPPR